ncbi:hypothetical protein GOV12_00700 [Candidatus Pacearchaeota archaeon]|nr:hypothetical protein [Candidatus Pacearchaeota archaeon]
MISSKYISVGILLVIVCVLIVTGPANAYLVDFVSDQTVIDKGVSASYSITLDLEESENLGDIDYLMFRLNKINDGDGIDFDCKFDSDGGIVSGCNGIEIIKVEETSCDLYGYGMGCDLKFNIFVDTTKFDSGEYKTFTIIKFSDVIDETKGNNLNIKEIKDLSCSIRAKEGELSFDGKDYFRTKISFYIPFREAKNGEGYITGQMKRDRFSYKFDVVRILENNEDMLRAEVSGKYRIGPYNVGNELAILTFDKITDEITIVGDMIEHRGGEVYFKKGH